MPIEVGGHSGYGGDTRQTGFDFLAETMQNLGFSVPPIQNSYGHYEKAAIVSAISSMDVPQKSKTCKIQGYDSVWNNTTYESDYIPPKLTIGNLIINLPDDKDTIEGDIYIDLNGNVSLS